MNPQEQRPLRRLLLRAGVIAALTFLIVVICGYVFKWEWTGLSKQTLWDWLALLIVPGVLAIGGYLFNRSETRATQAAAERRARDDALQAYLDHMSKMLIPNKDLPSLYKARPGDSLSSVARARTLTVLPRLDGDRKARVLQFLYEAGLITMSRPVPSLSGANLIDANLRGSYLSNANLNLASLSGAKLWRADLMHANLRGSYLSQADLSYANLSKAKLIDAYPNQADLKYADLIEADLSGADLSGADLSGTDLSGAQGEWTEDQLRAAKSLEGATMPDGQILKDTFYNPDGPTFDEWAKDRERGKEDADID